jgi:hypothetical protein
VAYVMVAHATLLHSGDAAHPILTELWPVT